ncbi:MAG: thioredoxin family protein [Verrucomicrobia bacterium 61-8]|nr:redoxin domain-containing protein [Verrucomicrobiota bacterium]OJV06776.1 MAG: thioredoxin family protein [Verrucomicrobia bacterium 61-8]
MKKAPHILAILALSAAVAFAAPEIGKPAPDFTLKDASGKEVKLSDYKGKYVVLEWVNFGCPFVKKHYGSGNMQALQKELTGKGAVWLSICSSAEGKQGYFPKGEVAAAVKANGSHATDYLLDTSGAVGKLYDAVTTPDMYLINPEGMLIYKGAIDDRPSPDPSTLADATNYVKVAFEEASAGKSVSNPSTKSYGCSVKY